MAAFAFRQLLVRAKAVRTARPKSRWRLARLALEALDARVLPSINTFLAGGILSINADNTANQVQVVRADPNDVQVFESSHLVGNFAADQVELVVFRQGAVRSTFDNETGIRDKQLRLADSYPLTPAELRQIGTFDALLIGDTLTLTGPSGAGFQVSGNWSATADVGNNGLITHTFTASGLMALHTALGDLPFPSPDNNPLQITTQPDALDANFGAVDAVSWNSGFTLDTTNPNSPLHPFQDVFGLQIAPTQVQFGVNLGNELGGLGAPLNNALPYIYLTATSGQARFGDISAQMSAANPLTLAFDPEDPFLYAGVNEFAVGGSLKGYIPYTPTLSLPGLASDPIYGHLYGRGTVTLAEFQTTVSGEVVLNLDTQHDGRLFNAIRDNVASYLLTGRVNLDELAQTARDDLRAGFNGHADIPYQRAGFDMLVPVDLSAAYVPGRFVAHGTATGDFLAGTPLSFLGNVTTVDVVADINTQGFDVIATADTVTVGGFNSAHAVVELNNQGITAAADLDVQFDTWTASAHIAGTVQPDGQYRFDGTGTAVFAGFVMARAHVTLTNNGLTADGDVTVPIGAQPLVVHFTGSGYIHPDGQFRLTGAAGTDFGGFLSANAAYVLDNGGLTADGDVVVHLNPWSGTVHFHGSVGFDGNYSLTGDANATVAGLAIAAHFVLANGGLSLSGDVVAHIGTQTETVHVVSSGYIHGDGRFRLTGTADANLGEYGMGGATFIVDNNGLGLAGNVTVHLGGFSTAVHFTGSLTLAGQYVLDGTAQASFAGFVSGNAHFHLTNNGLTVDGDVTIPIGPPPIVVHFTGEGYVHLDGHFLLRGNADSSYRGFAAANAAYALDNSGLTASGNLTLHLGSWTGTLPFTGYVHFDGQFRVTATANNLQAAGFILTHGQLVIDNQGATLDADGNFRVASRTVDVHVSSTLGFVHADGQYSLVGRATVDFISYGSAVTTFTLATSGLTMDVDPLSLRLGDGTVNAHLAGWLHFDGQFHVEGNVSAHYAGFDMPNSHLVLDNSGLTADGDVSVRLGSGTVMVHFHAVGTLPPGGGFRLEGNANATFAGFVMGNAHFVVTPSGLAIDGRIVVHVGSGTVTVNFASTRFTLQDGRFRLEGTATATTSFVGFISADAHWVLDNNGLTASGHLLDVHIGSFTVHLLPFDGYVHFDGQFQLTVHIANLTIAGFQAAVSTFTVNNSGATLDASVNLIVFTRSFHGHLGSNGQFSLTFSGSDGFAGFGASGSITIDNNGVTVSQDVNLIVFTRHFTGYVHTNGQFQLMYSGSSGFAGFGASGTITLNNNGVSLNETVNFVVGSRTFTGYIHTNGQFQLTFNGQVSFAGFSSTGTLTLNNGGLTASENVSVAHVGTVHMAGSVHTNGQFSFAFSGGFSVSGYAVASGSLTLSNNGVYVNMTGGLSIAFLGVHGHLTGWIYSNGNIGLDYSSSVHVGPLSGSVSLHLGTNGLTGAVHAGIDLSTSVLGVRFGLRIDVAASVGIATNGHFDVSAHFSAHWYAGFSGTISVGFHMTNSGLDIDVPWPFNHVHIGW